MTTRNITASVRQRLLNLARERKEDFQYVLIRYGLERFLYRLSQSEVSSRFVLKGAALFTLWTAQPHRMTRDVDLLAGGDNSIPAMEQIFRELCAVAVEEDGLAFLADTVRGEVIGEADEYQGLRMTLTATLGKATIPIQVDIGFGDAVTPDPIVVEYPVLLDLPVPKLRAYPKETVVAEKFQAMVELGMGNSRMKDFFDLWVIARQFEFEGELLGRAIRATFERRRTALPDAAPLALTATFYSDPAKQTQWSAFLKRTRPQAAALPRLDEVVPFIEAFLMPAARGGQSFTSTWPAGGPWTRPS